MAEYISKKNIRDSLVLIRSCDYESALSIINNMPTADVQPVKTTDEVSDLKEIIKNIYIETTTDHYGNPINALTEIDKILDETRHLWDSKRGDEK